jgi:hypothetical protein
VEEVRPASEPTDGWSPRRRHWIFAFILIPTLGLIFTAVALFMNRPTPPPTPSSAVAPTPSSGPSTGSWGAIAYSKPRAKIGVGLNLNSRENAEAAAVKNCNDADCVAVENFHDGCGAVSEDSNGNVGWGYGPSRATAQSYALAQVGSGARILNTYCTTGH